MKGLELPVNFLVVLLLVMISVVALVVFLQTSVNSGQDKFGMMREHSELCSVYADAKCVADDVAPKYLRDIRSKLPELCKKLGYVPGGSLCINFDDECGRPCCSTLCPMPKTSTTRTSTTATATTT